MLLVLRFEAPAPGLCTAARAETGVPPLTERARATPFVVDEEDGVGERAVPRDGDVMAAPVGSVDGRRPAAVPAGGFFVAVDMVCYRMNLGCES